MEAAIDELIDKLIINFRETVENALDSKEPDKLIINNFYNLREKFKKLKARASGLSDIGEFFYYRYILRTLENSLEITFTPEKKDKNLLYSKKYEADYKDKKIILTSNLKYGIPIKKVRRPDFFILIEAEGKIIPIAIFEIKVFIHKENIEKQIITKFNEFKSCFKINPPYFVCIIFSSDYGNEFERLMNTFVNLHEKCFYICHKDKNWKSKELSDGRIDGTPITEIMKNIIKFIKTQK